MEGGFIDDLDAKAGRRKVVNADNDIDLILAGRAKKHSVSVPSVDTPSGKRLRILIMNEKDFGHLTGEVTGERYDNPCRPELDYLTVGYDEHSTPASDHVHILYDHPKCLFILSKKCEDLIMCRIKDKSVDKFVVLSAVIKVGQLEFNTLDPFRQRLFRRFMREHFVPLQKDEVKMAEAVERIASRFHEHQEGIESDSESSAASEEEQLDAVKTKKKKPVIRASKIVAKTGGAPASRSTSIVKDGSKARPLGSSIGGSRRTISSFSKK